MNRSENRLPEALVTDEVVAEPFVRSATADDIDALVRIHLESNPDVYGISPDEATLENDRIRAAQHLALVGGEHIKIIEDPVDGPYGLLSYCRTSYNKQDLLDIREETDNIDVLRRMHDPNGKNAFGMSLAIIPERRGKNDHLLLMDAVIQQAAQEGVGHIYGDSRMPGFDAWATQRQEAERASNQPQSSDRALAEEYWQATTQRGGVEKPLDPLLRMYVNFGLRPVALREGIWEDDVSSRGFGVLIEYDVSQAATDQSTVTQM